MESEKKQIIDIIENLPEDTTFDDAIYALYMGSKLRKSQEDIRNGRVITLEEFSKEMEEKIENSIIERS